MRVLVTGGNRYIGVDLVFELAKRGHDVTVINSHETSLPDGVQRIHADRRQPGALEAALKDHRDAFDVVFDHTAFDLSDIQPMVELFRGRIAQPRIYHAVDGDIAELAVETIPVGGELLN